MERLIQNYPPRRVAFNVVEDNLPSDVIVRVDGGSYACRVDYQDHDDETLEHFGRLFNNGNKFIHVVTFNNTPEEEVARYNRRTSYYEAFVLQLHNEQFLQRYQYSYAQAQNIETAKDYVSLRTEKMSPEKYLLMCQEQIEAFIADGYTGKFMLNLPCPGTHNSTVGQRNRLTIWLNRMLNVMKETLPLELRDKLMFSLHCYPGLDRTIDLSQVYQALSDYGFADIPVGFTEVGLHQDELKDLEDDEIPEIISGIVKDVKDQMRPIDILGHHVLSHTEGFGAIDNDGLTETGELVYALVATPDPDPVPEPEPECVIEYLGRGKHGIGYRYKGTKSGRTRYFSTWRKPKNPEQKFCPRI